MNDPLMLFLPPAECKNPNPRWSELTDLHQLQRCSAGLLAGRAQAVGCSGGQGDETEWSPDQIRG